MIYQNDKYKLIIAEGNITISTYNLLVDKKLVYGIYNKSDYNYRHVITTGELLSNSTRIDAMKKDGSYVILIRIIFIDESCIIVTDDSIGYTFDFKVYTSYTNTFYTIVTGILCECNDCGKTMLSNCDSCIETDELKTKYNSLIFIIFYILYYAQINEFEPLIKYLNAIISKYELKISDRFSKMINYGNLRGIFELDEKNIYLLLTATYIYLYVYALDRSDYDLELDVRFNIERIKTCLYQNGLDFSLFEKTVLEYDFKGTVSTTPFNCMGNTDCFEVINVLDNLEFNYYKQDLVKGIVLPIINTEDRIIIAIPKVWGIPDEILDDSNTNIKDIFNMVDIAGKYVYISNDIYTKGNYTIKLKYYE